MTPADMKTAVFDPTAEAVALKSFELMQRGTYEEFEQLIHPDCVNHEAKDEPPACRQPGPAGVWATALWLREAFEDVRWEVHEVVAERDLVVVHCTMSGRHVKPFVGYDEHARVKEAFPPTGRRFAVTQTHWIRVTDGRFAEHWANRDDLGMAEQAGWVPPTPAYLLRMALARHRARKEAKKAA